MIALLIILCILAILGTIAGYSFLIYKNYINIEYDNSNRLSPETKIQNFKHKRKIIGHSITGSLIFLLFLFGMIIGPIGMYTIQTGNVAVVKTFGEVKSIETAGLHWKNIFTDNVTLFNLQSQRYDMQYAAYTPELVAVTFTLNVQYTFKTDTTSIKNYITKYNTQNYVKEILPIEIKKACDASSKGITLSNIATKQDEMQIAVNIAMASIADTYFMNAPYVAVIDAVIPEAIENENEKLEAAKKANEILIENAKAAVKIETEKAAQALAKAEGEAAAAKAKAEGDAAVLEAIAKAEAKSIELIAEAEAKAISLKLQELMGGESGNGDLKDALAYMEYLAWVERWDGKLPQYVLGDAIGIFLP